MYSSPEVEMWAREVKATIDIIILLTDQTARTLSGKSEDKLVGKYIAKFEHLSEQLHTLNDYQYIKEYQRLTRYPSRGNP